MPCEQHLLIPAKFTIHEMDDSAAAEDISPSLGDLPGSNNLPHIKHLQRTYNTYLVSFQKRSRLLRECRNGSANFTDPYLEARDDAEMELPAPLYNTGAGQMTFEQLYARTSRIVGSILREVFGLLNPEDVDDCMQAGYLKVWQKLQAEPDYFAGKPVRYIVQAVLFRCKAQRYAHIRHYRKLVYDAKVYPNSADNMSGHRLDTWIDLADALTTTVHVVIDNGVLLVSLYTLITQVTAQDIQRTFGYSRKLLSNGRDSVRAMLAHRLPDYGTVPDPDGIPIWMAAYVANGHGGAGREERPSEGLVMTRLLAGDVQPLSRRNGHYTRTQPVRLNGQSATGTVNTAIYPASHHNLIRTQVRPFPSETAGDRAYATGWKGHMTLEDIMNDPDVQRSAAAKARRLGVLDDADVADCIQQGFIRLWQELQHNPHLIADKGPVWVGIYVAYAGDSKKFIRQKAKYQRFDDPDFDWEDADEYLALGLPEHRAERQAAWAQTVDEIHDLQTFMSMMAARYMDDEDKLLTLYALTTSVKIQDITPLLSVRTKHFAALHGNVVKQEMRAVFRELYGQAASETWQDRLARGEGLEHIRQIAEEVGENFRQLLALYILTTSVTKKAVLETFGIGTTRFRREMKQVRGYLQAAFRQ